jgi:hypothetical protein
LLPAQVLPQVPQLVRSVWRLTHTPEVQVNRPVLHWHWLLTQSLVVASQVVAHEPQWSGSALTSMQPPPQSNWP